MNPTKQNPLSRGDTGALIAFCGAGVAIATTITILSGVRIAELARGTDVPVLVEFVGQRVEIPLGAGGTGVVPVELDRATITAPELPMMATVPGILGQIIQIITIIVVIGSLILLARSMLSGRIFGRGRTTLVATAGITGLVGFAMVRFFENMLANATVAAVTDTADANAVISVEPFTFILAAFVVALITTVFVIGDRLQRDTEGLV
ncbi:MAG: hypothetical protein P0Y60_16820 [Candidatus Microbacterium colombiense]|nr:MAG: hypothetical protein P0Y60_16820 [Microbacterium sp.]